MEDITEAGNLSGMLCEFLNSILKSPMELHISFPVMIEFYNDSGNVYLSS